MRVSLFILKQQQIPKIVLFKCFDLIYKNSSFKEILKYWNID